MNNNHEIDHQKLRGYELSVQADKFIQAGLFNEAHEVLKKAAESDATYYVRALSVPEPDERKIQVSVTVRKLLIPPILGRGFKTPDGTAWKKGVVLERVAEGIRNSLYIGRQKFGHGLGVDACKQSDEGIVQRFDWRTINLRTGTLVYKTQKELESVCLHWVTLLETHIFPWFANK